MKNVNSRSKKTVLGYSQVNLGVYFSKKMFSERSETFMTIFEQHFLFVKDFLRKIAYYVIQQMYMRISSQIHVEVKNQKILILTQPIHNLLWRPTRTPPSFLWLKTWSQKTNPGW